MTRWSLRRVRTAESVSPESSYYEQPTLIEPSARRDAPRVGRRSLFRIRDTRSRRCRRREQADLGLPPAPSAEAHGSHGHQDDVISLAIWIWGRKSTRRLRSLRRPVWVKAAESQPVGVGEMTIPMEMPAEILAFDEAPSHEAAPPAQPPSGAGDNGTEFDDLSPMGEAYR